MKDLIDKMELKLCNKVCFAGGMGYGLHQDELIEFYKAAFNAGIEAACGELHKHDDEFIAEQAIRALEMK